MNTNARFLLPLLCAAFVSCDNGFDYPGFEAEPLSSLDRPYIFYTPIDPQDQKGLYTTLTRQSIFSRPLEGDNGYFGVYDFATNSVSRRLRYMKEDLPAVFRPCIDVAAQKTYFAMSDGRMMLWDNATGILDIFMSGLSTGGYPELAQRPSASGKIFLLSNLVLVADDKRYGIVIDPVTGKVIWEPHLTAFTANICYVDPVDDRFFCDYTPTHVEMLDLPTKTVTPVRLAEDGYYRSSLIRSGSQYIAGQVPFDAKALERPSFIGLPELVFLSATDFSLQSKVVIGADVVPVAEGSYIIAIYPWNGELYVIVSSGSENILLKWSAVDGKFLQWSAKFPFIWGRDRIMRNGKVYFIANDNFASFFFNTLDLSTGEVTAPETVWVY